jgi:hypothetical protein
MASPPPGPAPVCTPFPCEVEGDRVDVDSAGALVRDDEARGPVVQAQREAERLEKGEDIIDRPKLHDHVHVIVGPCLLTQQSIHAPTAVQPKVEAGFFKPAYNLDYV